MTGILILDKPADWTSHDAIGKLRGVFKQKRIGHGGTLDPMATGILPIFLGRATRAVSMCETMAKEYLAEIRLGVVTDTQDITGKILSENHADIGQSEFADTLAFFTGSQAQLPPMYSAIKIGGKKLYELARKGIEVERPPRDITIYSIDIIAKTEAGYLFRVVCSKGTYIRTLCHDIGARLGCGGTLSSLRRTRVGAFSIDDAVTMDEVLDAASRGDPTSYLRPVDSLFSNYPSLVVTGGDEDRCRNGSECRLAQANDGRYRVYNAQNEFLLIGMVESGILHTEKSFFEVQ